MQSTAPVKGKTFWSSKLADILYKLGLIIIGAFLGAIVVSGYVGAYLLATS